MATKIEEAKRIRKRSKVPRIHQYEYQAFVECPVVDGYGIKDFHILDPESQLRLNLEGTKCHCGSRRTVFKSYSTPRPVTGLFSTYYACYAIYVCRDCHKSLSTMDEHDFGCLSTCIHLNSFVIRSRSAYSTDLLFLMEVLVTAGVSTTGVSNIIAKCRFHQFLKHQMQYYSHKSYYGSLSRSFYPLPEGGFASFPGFFQHCSGYNESTGPKGTTIGDVIIGQVDPLIPYYIRTIAGSPSTTLRADHTFWTPERIRILDSTTNRMTAPFSALHGGMNEYGFITTLLLASSANDKQRFLQGESIKRRNESRDKRLRVVYQDRCCDDFLWLGLKKVTKDNGELQFVYQDEDPDHVPPVKMAFDAFHVVQRYTKSLKTNDANDQHTATCVSREISAVVTNEKNYNTPGEEIYQQITDILKRFNDIQPLPQSLWDTHKLQEKHFRLCWPVMEAKDAFTFDRNGRSISLKGTSQLESFWQSLRRCMPAKVTVELGVVLLLLHTVNFNMDRRQMMDGRWPCVPLHPSDILYTQFLGIKEGGFPIIPLSLTDEKDVYGLSSTFHQMELIPSASAPTHLKAFFNDFVNNAAFDSSYAEPQVIQLLDTTLGTIAESYHFDDLEVFESSNSTNNEVHSC